MPARLPPLNALRTFEVAARHLSFKHAGEELAVTPAAISHQIKLLEDFLGVALFRRLTRALELTEQGEAMLPKVREGLACMATAVERVRAHDGNDPLAVVAPPSFASRWLVPRLKQFTAREPSIILHLISSLSMVDSESRTPISGRELPGLRNDADQVFIHYGIGNYPGCQVDRIFAPEYVAVCSPALLQGEHPLRVPDDVRYHTLLQDDTLVDERVRPEWEEWLRIAGVRGVDPTSGPHFSDAILVLSAAIDGQGIAIASKPLVASELKSGRLVAPFTVEIGHHYAYYLVIPDAMAERPAVRAFRSWLLTARD